MIQLPSNVTVAALSVFVGAVLGLAGGYWWWAGGVDTSEGGRMAIYEPPRPILPQDTSGQDEPDVEIRFRTRTDTVRDTVAVPIPSSLSRRPMLSDATPIGVTSNRVRWTYFDSGDGRWEQRVYEVPEDRVQFGLYAVGLRQWNPTPTYQAGVGAELRLDPEWLPGAIEPFGEVRVGRQIVASTGLRWHIVTP
jgi:hypothetical protein